LAFEGKEELGKCEFCRQIDADTDEERVDQVNELVKKNNPGAMEILARYHAFGEMGFRVDYSKSNELLLKAGELGSSEAYYNLGNAYYHGKGVERNVKKGKKYWELAAIGGNVSARNNLGATEGYAGNEQRAYRHFMIAAKAGDKECLDKVRKGFERGAVTKDDYAEALREYQKIHEETKSEMRDEAPRYQANPSLYAALCGSG
jgi:TPR repeat protein